MKLQQLASRPNLELAWRRITTGTNLQYKTLYRNLYYVYEVAIEANLRDLRDRILGGTFEPKVPERVYLPKPSGLHRPISLLYIEDQIVLQAFANLAAKKAQKKRKSVQLKIVFSNILQTSDSIFFFRQWQITYNAFQKRIKKLYGSGMRWVADFDLAAFYETISHELLLKTLYPRTSNSDLDWIARCLLTWSSDRLASGHGHGLPQGPLASDFLAECFLLPIDLEFEENSGYVRYVDDVRFLGKTEGDVRKDVIELERHCRERGLIPQAGKFAIKKAEDVQDALGMLPSITDPQYEDGGKSLDENQSKDLLASAIAGNPQRVVDKTRLRYVLYRAEPADSILKIVLQLIPRHPEHCDVFFTYLSRFDYKRSIERLCLGIVANNPYTYVRGEAWHVLAHYRRDTRSLVYYNSEDITNRAIRIAKGSETEGFMEQWGGCHFLCASEEMSGRRYARFVKFQKPLLQSFLAPVLPGGAIRKKELIEMYLGRTAQEPGLSVCPIIHTHRIDPRKIGIQINNLPSQVVNTLRELGVVSAPSKKVDPIAEILRTRYGIIEAKSWHQLLGGEYVHALGLLKQGEAVFDAGRSLWLTCQNGFNQILFCALQLQLKATNHPAAGAIRDRNGQLLDFGVTLDKTRKFSIQFPRIADCFREINDRRNRIPATHPYEKRTGRQSQNLSKSERNRFVGMLQTAYADLAQMM